MEPSCGEISQSRYFRPCSGVGDDSFEDDPPNAALILNGSDGAQKTIIVELLKPVFDDEMQVLTYEVVAAGNSGESTVFERDGSVDQEGEIAREFGQATLFIDSIDWEFTVPHGFCITDGAIIDCSCDPGYVQDGDRGACVEDTFS
jgi:hypothetical protein